MVKKPKKRTRTVRVPVLRWRVIVSVPTALNRGAPRSPVGMLLGDRFSNGDEARAGAKLCMETNEYWRFRALCTASTGNRCLDSELTVAERAARSAK